MKWLLANQGFDFCFLFVESGARSWRREEGVGGGSLKREERVGGGMRDWEEG
jgi:hypothetical protein